ncbi:Na+/H+ antiporter subunit E [Nonomuraea typhae]|uniref:Na+/H+ antiporter subunit E n=1 Tax=Nonomuraea typhae TaxID=2603600 RepID=UPI0012F88456|nr:Na+/H+ antiporter subunit E [Nonomuraea typhae]
MKINVIAPRIFGRRVPLPLVGWLALIWVLLWGDLSLGNAVAGLLAGAIITWLIPLPLLDPGIRVRPLALLAFLPRYAADMALSSVRVAWWALRPGACDPPVTLTTAALRTSSEPMTTLIIVTLSSLPGSLVVEAYTGRKELVVHALGTTDAGAVQADVTRLESRVIAAFGTKADREELR